MEFIFYFSLMLIVYSYFIYPVLLAFFACLCSRPVTLSSPNASDLPDLTVVISAFNEETCIKQRVENILSQDYPTEKITLLIGSDGSRDNTNTILSGLSYPQLKCFFYEENQGKAATLNQLLREVKSDFVIFSDANTFFKADAIACLVRHFTDQQIGAVCGELQLINQQENDNKESNYWQ